jgi:geranylgeranyl diphosphate synthase type I
MRYHLGWEDEGGSAIEARGGKLLRPALCLLACEALGGDWRAALPAAAAIELLHNFTLIHDDVEDASPRRHGRPTLWKLYGEAQAINAGDGMFALAHVTLLRLAERGVPNERVLAAARALDEASLRLCAGQHLDLTYSTRDAITEREYLDMIGGKTAALLAASCAMGALLAGGDGATTGALYEFGRRLGLAFQVRDDLLGIWGDAAETGKPVGGDLIEGKKSYPVVVALERSGARQAELLAALADAASGGDAGAARGLLEELGARGACERAAVEHGESAIASLAGLALDADRRGELEALARFAATRAS